MPPRKAAGAPAKRATRASARKSTAKTLAAKDPSESSPTKALEITVPTSSPITPNSSDKPSSEVPSETLPTTIPETTSLTSPVTSAPETSSERATDSAPKFDAEITEPAAVDGNLGEKAAQSPETAAIEAVAPETAAVEGIEGSGVETTAVVETAVSVLPPLETAAGEGSVPENIVKGSPETAGDVAENVAAPKPVVKKTVRIVKKVVKKKKLVTKRVAKSLVACSNKESEKVEIGVDGNNGNPNSSVTDSMEVEKPNPSVLAAMEVEDPNPSVAVSMEVENPNPNVTISLEVEQPNKSEVCEGEKEVNLIEVASVVCVLDSVSDQNKGDVVKKPDSDNGVLVETSKEVKLTEVASVVCVLDSVSDQNKGDVVKKPDSDNGVLVETLNADSVGGGNDENVTENADLGDGGDVGVKEEVENCDVSGSKVEVEVDNEVVVLSEEMEALERRRRRKTEIFIGGLDKSAKEEDIRKVFEEVGEVVEVRLMMNSHTGKNKGYAFLRYASAADAKKALEKYSKVEICGKQCGTAPVEGNDTIFLGNIDKKWKNEDVIKLLQEIGIEKIDKVTVMADPNNIVCNRGFAFLELETNRDAQNAYKKLQKKDVFGKHHNIKVAWAEPLNEPDEEEMLKVKSVYAEFIPSSWDEEKVRDYFKKFGEIDNVVLARNLRSSKRKDFAFVNYTTREAALACIESFSHELSNDEGSKVNVKVSLAKPIPKGKPNKRVSNPISKESFKDKPKAAQRGIKPNDPRNKGKTRINFEDRKGDRVPSTTAKLVQLSREQASWRQSQTGLGIGSVNLEYPYTLPARKRPYSALEDDPRYSDVRGYPRTRFESSYPVANPSYNTLPQGAGMTSLPYYQRQGAGYTSGSPYGITDHSSSIQREGASHRGSGGLYYRY